MRPFDRPLSPCNKVCVLDAAGFCMGCLRTSNEIASWTSMSATEQWQLIDKLAERRKHSGSSRVTPADGGSEDA